MPDNKDLKVAIQTAIANFEANPLAEASLDLLGTLGYRSERRLSLKPNNAKQFQAEFDARRRMNPEAALVMDWLSVDLLIQVTDAEIQHAASGMVNMFASKKVDDKDIRSYLFFAIELQGKQYTRTQLAGITREINKLFPMPVMVIFKYNKAVSLAIIARRINKKDGSKDVLEKVTLIKDIRFTGNRAQIEILHDLSITQLMQDHAISNFVELQKAWEKTLDLNELNKKFYKEIAYWYFWAVKIVKFPKDSEKDEATRNATNVIRLITRLIFVWFIKEKGLVPEDLFDERKLKEMLNFSDPKKSTYYKAVLQNLFFATLNTEMGADRVFRRENAKGQDPDYLMSNFYQYKRYFKNPDVILELFAQIPFLNGGLFECLDKEIEKGNVIRVDGFSDREDNPLQVPDDLFLMEKEKELDLNELFDTKNKKYKVRGLIPIFNSYKFTIEENTPIEEEIALDPELLGKVFENLLAAYNPETGTTARKQTGSFYTPREIVNYMVDVALLAYLNSEFGMQNAEMEERLRDLLSYNPTVPNFTDAEKSRLIAAIDNVKVLDPAAGSGAFPMGVLHKLVFLLGKLDPNNDRWKQRQIDNTKVSDPLIREAQIKIIDEIFSENHDDYGRKLFLIENCIYGVDIQPIAVQIAKLRFFISLVVDQKTNVKKPNLGIRPLPNLETKFVAANTLIGINRPDTKTVDEAPVSIPPEVEAACDMLIAKLVQYLKSRNDNLRAQYIREAQEFADVINTGMGADFQPLMVDRVFTTAKDTAALKGLLPVKREVKASALVLRNQQIEEKEKELKCVRREHFSARALEKKRKYRDLDKKLRLEIADLLNKNHALEDETAQQLADWDPYNQNAHADFFDPGWMFGIESGFDVVISNPPYVVSKDSKLKEIYEESVYGRPNLYGYFIHNAIESLLKSDGTLIFINPRTLLTDAYTSSLRNFILKYSKVRSVLNIVDRRNVFESVLQSCIVNEFQKSDISKGIKVKTILSKEDILEADFIEVTPADFVFGYEATGKSFLVAESHLAYNIFRRLRSFSTFEKQGIEFTTGKIQWDLYKQSLSEDPKRKNSTRLIWAENIQRYYFAEPRNRIDKLFINSPLTTCEPISHATLMVQRTTAVEQQFRIIATKVSPEMFGHPIQAENHTSYLEKNENAYNLNFILGLLNSKFMDFFFRHINSNTQVSAGEINALPIPSVGKNIEKSISELVIKIITIKEASLIEDTSALEKEIDRIVYYLYELKKEEIAIIEGIE